ncbi:Cupin domain-containing protein [Cladophialophora immunda]|nr:Cupin domain-containing protein [Cladophialophora immunda]
MTEPATKVEGLPKFSRHITTHNADGVAIFATADPADPSSSAAGSISPEPTWSNFPTSGFGLAYATDTIPADFNGNADLDVYNGYQQKHPGITIKGGSVCRVVDMGPGAKSPMHRTVSIDYGVVLEGEVELELDSGEKRRLARGDIFVQRGTMHMWRNPSDSKPVRLLAIQLDSKEVEVERKGALPELFLS